MHSTHPGIAQDHPLNTIILYLTRIIFIMCIMFRTILHMTITDLAVTIQ